MVFGNRRAWIETDYVPMILDEDGYVPVQESEVQPGDVAVYRSNGEISHVALVVARIAPAVADLNGQWKTTVLSQWGQDGEYLHDLEDVAERLGTFDQFYSEKRRL